MPDDQLAQTTSLDDEGLAIALLRIRGQRTPDFFARPLVKCHHRGVRLPADNNEDVVSIYQSCTGDSPGRHLHAVVFDVILLPDHVTCPSVQTEELPASPN